MNCRVFALLLLLFEFRVPKTEPLIKKFFGFMYTYSGRAAFLMLYVPFCGLLSCLSQLGAVQHRRHQFRDDRHR
jgi:hypothetical protein